MDEIRFGARGDDLLEFVPAYFTLDEAAFEDLPEDFEFADGFSSACVGGVGVGGFLDEFGAGAAQSGFDVSVVLVEMRTIGNTYSLSCLSRSF